MIIFVVLLIARYLPHAKGQIFALYAILYSIARFFLETMRGDYGTLAFGLKSAQLTSLAIIVGGLVACWWFAHQNRISVATPPASKTKRKN